jgi:hypothetical protein
MAAGKTRLRKADVPSSFLWYERDARLAPRFPPSRYDVKRLGSCEGVEEHFFAIGTDKKVVHPLVQRLLPVKVVGKG